MVLVNPMRSRFLSILVVSLSTVGSRVLGLFRDILVFSIFGSSVLNSAFILAFTFPNLFRRLLGEGALTAALLPLLTEQKENYGEDRLFWLYNKILSRVMTLLFVIVGLGSLLMIMVSTLQQQCSLHTRTQTSSRGVLPSTGIRGLTARVTGQKPKVQQAATAWIRCFIYLG